mmetsp:Transcript_4001/g.4625  ORF Transcript_4001/g.4625 Transcript_4001/m.4625 type:complete len:181 (+) Transcript_4001:348-890(+)
MVTKRLSPKLQHRGHGTLELRDIAEVSKVNIKSLDVKRQDLQGIGRLGELPQEPRCVRVDLLKVRQKSTTTHSIQLFPGKYILNVQLKKPRHLFGQLTHCRLKVYVTAWLLPGNKKFSNFRADAILSRNQRKAELKFEVTKKDCSHGGRAQLQMNFTSHSSMHSCKIATTVFELDKLYCL